jgi:hypothetical protein
MGFISITSQQWSTLRCDAVQLNARTPNPNPKPNPKPEPNPNPEPKRHC